MYFVSQKCREVAERLCGSAVHYIRGSRLLTAVLRVTIQVLVQRLTSKRGSPYKHGRENRFLVGADRTSVQKPLSIRVSSAD